MSGTTPNISLEKQRFIQVLEEARIKNKYSQRQLCDSIGITIGTLTKYNRGSVDPNRVGVAIMRRLAGQLGITTNALMEFLDTGEFRSSITIDDVASWIRSESGQEDLPRLLSAVAESAQRETSPAALVHHSSDAVPAFAGYTDSEAEEWCINMHNAIKDLCAATGEGIRSAWSRLEAKLHGMALTPAEVDMCWDVAVQGKVFTGEELTAARNLFKGRFPYNCPLNAALAEFDELRESKALIFCLER